MNYTNIINGIEVPFQAVGFARSVLLNQLGFDLQRAVFKTQTQTDTPVFDESLAEAMGDTGLPQATKLDVDQLTNGCAAAFVLLARHIQKVDPDTGRKPEYLLRYLKGPKEIMKAAVDYRLNSRKAQALATAASLKADPTKRIAALELEIRAQCDAILQPLNTSFVESVKSMRDMDDDELADTALEAMVDAGRDPAKEIKRAAQAYVESQKKRFEEGGFVNIDAFVAALAGVAA